MWLRKKPCTRCFCAGIRGCRPEFCPLDGIETLHRAKPARREQRSSSTAQQVRCGSSPCGSLEKPGYCAAALLRFAGREFHHKCCARSATRVPGSSSGKPMHSYTLLHKQSNTLQHIVFLHKNSARTSTTNEPQKSYFQTV